MTSDTLGMMKPKRPHRNILLIMERDNFEKDRELIAGITSHLHISDHELLWYNPLGAGKNAFLDPTGKLASYPRSRRRLIKAMRLLLYPDYWKHYLSLRSVREKTVEGKVENLRRFLRRYPDARITILSRSAGGRISSLLANEAGVAKLVCLGYPFKHPDHDDEPARYQHLDTLRTPFLILQGMRDQYGGTGTEQQYALSPLITLEYVDTDHDFKLSEKKWSEVIERINQFLRQ